jgi:ABC-type Fe3+ transport system permease subunit
VTDHDGGRSVAKLFGGLLMAVGGLMAALCGLCSAGVVVMSGANGLGGVAAMMMMALIFGGPPIVIGVGVFLWGRSLWRGPSPKPAVPKL